MSASEKSLSRLLLKMAFRNAGMVLGPLHQLSGRTVCFGKLVGGLEFCDCELSVLNFTEMATFGRVEEVADALALLLLLRPPALL